MATEPPLREQHRTVDVGGRPRTFLVVSSEATSSAAARPLVLVLHGSNQTGAAFRAFAAGSFDRWAGGGAVVAYLDGYHRNWNDARRHSDFAARRDGVDDVAFVRAVVATLRASDGIDPDRVVAVGYSAGGSLVFRLVHEIGGELAGAATLGAAQPVPENTLALHAPEIPVRLVTFHGTRDPLVPYAGGTASLWGFRPRGLGRSAPETAAYFAARNGIEEPPVTTVLATPPQRGILVERTEHRQEGRLPVVLYTVRGGGHTVPGGRRGFVLLGPVARHLSAAEAIAEHLALPHTPADTAA